MRVMCCIMFSPSHIELAGLAIPNIKEYAKRHGYYYHIIEIENDKWEYKKHETFRIMLGVFDLIWYRDVDSLVTNMNTPITNFIDDDHDFFITEDIHELNGGSVIIKNTKGGECLNKFVLDRRDLFHNEQNIYNAYRKDLSKNIKVLPQNTINSYDYGLYPEYGKLTHEQGQWEEGDFVLHTPGAPMNLRIETLKNAKITR